MVYSIAIEANFKTDYSIEIFFVKKTIDEIRFVFFFPKEDVTALMSKEIKNITHFLLLKAYPISVICVVFYYE